MLYFIVLTIFTSFMVWDTDRVQKKRGDFCGACFCEEQTFLCCNASCLSAKQKAFSGIVERKVSEVKMRFGDVEDSDPNAVELKV